VLALGAGVVILVNDADQVASTNRIAPAVQQSQTQLPAGTRFDGGPDEGSRGATSYYDLPSQRSSYQPAPADGTKARAGGPSMLPQGPGAR
jgi:hypothetical protein